MNYNIIETSEEIRVEVRIKRGHREKMSANTDKVMKHLSEKGIIYFDCLQESYVNNRHSKYSGVWIFRKSKKEKDIINEEWDNLLSNKEVQEPSPPNEIISINVKKVVDSSNTNVIKSRSSSNKKTKTRRKRKSTRRVANK